MSEAQDFIGQVLQNTYRIERLIAEGGMGAVFEAAHLRASQRVAVKVLFPCAGVFSSDEALARFRSELDVTSALGHPHIAQVVEANRTADGTPYVVMELLDGESLETRLQRVGRLDPLSAGTIVRQAAAALQAAHNSGTVHQDLKPSNIFLCRREVAGPGEDEDYVKLLDFGLSKLLRARGDLTGETIVLGTPWYMAPEQAARRSAAVTVATDVYALGAILYRMVTGRPPFADPDVDVVLQRIQREKPPPFGTSSSVTPTAEAVVQRALSKRALDRFATISELSEAFAAAVGLRQTFVDQPTHPWRAPATRPPVDGQDRDAATTEEIATVGAQDTPPPVGGQDREQASTEEIEPLDVQFTPPLTLMPPPELTPPPRQQRQLDPSMLTPEIEDSPTLPGKMPGELLARMPLPGPLPTSPPPLKGVVLPSTRPPSRQTTRTRSPFRQQRVVLVVCGLGLLAGLGLWLGFSLLGEMLPPRQLDAGAGVAAGPSAGDHGAVSAPRPSPTPVATPLEDNVARQTRSLSVTTRPAGVQVLLAGKVLGTTPLERVTIPTEQIVLTLRRQGYLDRQVEVEAGGMSLRLKQVPMRRRPRARSRVSKRNVAPGALKISARGKDGPIVATIYLDGRRIGRSPLVHKRVRPGVHNVEARHRGFRSARKRVRVAPGKEASVVLLLRR